ncbi:hypothetical protein [Leifsonia sp. fls2-241-R2A-40a]|uniref:hypothetical protein n=1 Tax=Leifsonia sp. fls2-241-R2A-40a TaxID=3040290 RepID=UPI002549D715|nr:hypothetical protein [Leifsonia sp. fls2-241-R2A-40a]
MRFISFREKAVVIAVLVLVSAVLALLLDAFHAEAGSIILTILQALGWYLASRLFRGPGESVRAARPWWRMTNRPLLSGVLAAVYGLVAVVNIGFSFAGWGSLSGTVSIIAELALAALFTLSYSRLSSLARATA